jgi:hypothetical protein
VVKQGQFQVNYMDLIEWRKKKSSKGKLKFVPNEQFPSPKGMFKKWVMTVGSAPVPAGARISTPQMAQEHQIVNQVGSLVLLLLLYVCVRVY